MEIAVALDSPRHRDLEFYEGDDAVLSITVYAKDGDTTPVAVTDARIEYGSRSNTITAGDAFTSHFAWRTPYRALGTVGGKLTTLAHGLITSPGWVECTTGFLDYGMWVWGTPPVPDTPTPIPGNFLAYNGGLIAYNNLPLGVA